MTANNNNIFEGFEDLDSMMASFIAETEKSAAPVAPKTTAVKAKEQKISADKEKKPKKTMIRVSGAKEFVFGNKTTPISDGTFAKANVSEDDVCAAFAKATESWCSGKAFSAKLVSSAIRIGYTKVVVGDGDTILAPIYGYPVVTPEGDSFDMNGTITVAAIRDRLRELGGVYAKYADPAYGFVQDVDRFYIVPIAGEFEMPFTESVMVAWEGKGVVVTMVAATKASASKDNDEEEDLESEESEAKTEDAKPASLTSAAIRDAFEKKVKGVGNFELARKADGTLIAVPVTDHFNKPAKSSTVAESEIQRPITPTLKIYWGRGNELPLYNLEPKGNLPGTIGMTTISEKEALKILQAWFPEYSIIKGMTWFEEQNYWYPHYPSSTKGGGALETPLFSVSEDNTVEWLAPKIGRDLLAKVWKAFLEEEAGSGNEMAAAMLLDERTNSWRVSFPSQTATPTRVSCNYGEECVLPYESVGVQLHSHPNMSISFSSIDDQDELSESTLFCVLRRGNTGKGHELDCRIRHKGKFFLVPMELAFDL